MNYDYHTRYQRTPKYPVSSSTYLSMKWDIEMYFPDEEDMKAIEEGIYQGEYDDVLSHEYIACLEFDKAEAEAA